MNRLSKLFLIGFSLLFIALVFNHFLNNGQNNGILSKDLITPEGLPQLLEENKNNSKTLRAVVINSLSGAKGTYAVAIKNLKTGEFYFANEHKAFSGGSLYKLWVMATAYRQIQEGILKEDEITSEDVTSLNEKFNIDNEVAELSDGVITLSVSEALKQMITISHNYAALLLTEKVKLSSVKTFLEENSFKESVVGTESGLPTTTAYDVAMFFEKLSKGELTDQSSTEKMLNLLKGQTLNDKLPRYLPKGTVVAHKTGEIGGFSHDGGIVYSPNGDYIVVVLSESDVPFDADGYIAQVSKAVYEYFQNKR